MSRTIQRIAISTAIVLGSVLITLLLGGIHYFELLRLKAQDISFILRGVVPTQDILLIGIDQKTLDKYPEPRLFWHKIYADAMLGAAEAGAKVFVLDITFGIPVTKYEPDNDSYLAGAFIAASATMPIVAAYVPESMGAQRDARFAVPINMLAATMGAAGFANLTVDADADDFVRRQELLEAPKPGIATDALARSMALLAAEKFAGQSVQFNGGSLYLAGKRIPVDADRSLIINYAGPPATFPMVPLGTFLDAARRHDRAKLEGWVKGKIVLLGEDNYLDRYDTPFYTFHSGDKFTMPGYEVHANTIRTLLTGAFLQPVPGWARIAALVVSAGACVAVVASFTVPQTAFCLVMLLFGLLGATQLFFRAGWLFSASEMLLSFGSALIGGIVYRFATAEKKSSFFRGAVALFVGKQVATALDRTQRISLEGDRVMVTILFTDIRGFTAFCESKDPAVVVDLLNVYMSKMVAIIVKYGGHVNKFIGDGILAVFSDSDALAQPGDHALRTVRCATEMVSEVVGDFRTGAGLHSGEVVIGNVGSSDKLEFTVLGNTVNLASRLESLNKDQQTKLLMSEESNEMLKGVIDTVCLGAVPVKGKTERMKLFTVASLLDESRIAELSAEAIS